MFSPNEGAGKNVTDNIYSTIYGTGTEFQQLMHCFVTIKDFCLVIFDGRKICVIYSDIGPSIACAMDLVF